MFNFNNKRKGYGSVGVPGFNNSKKRGTISNGDWDGDGVRNSKDCEPLNWRKQGPEHEKIDWKNYEDNKKKAKHLVLEELYEMNKRDYGENDARTIKIKRRLGKK